MFNIFGSRKTAGTDPRNNHGLYVFGMPNAGIYVDEEKALTYSAVYACIRIISETIRTLPFRVYKEDGENKNIDAKHPADRLLRRKPNPEMSARVFRETLTAHCLTHGNGYAEIEHNRMDEPVALWPITPDRVTPKRNDQGKLVYEVRQDDGRTIDIPAHKMFHIKGLSFDGLVGYSPVALAKESISHGLATEQFGQNFFGNGAMPGLVVENPQGGPELDEKGITRLLNSIKKRIGGKKKLSPFYLDGGMKATPVTVPPEQAQFLESRKFNVTEIARWFRVPPHKLADLERATFSNIEHQSIEYVVDTIVPWVTRWEEEADAKLFNSDESEYFTKMNVKGLLRGDLETRAKFYQTMFNMGVYSIDEIRVYEDENPIGGDVGALRLVPMNMISVEQAARGEGGKADPEKLKIVQARVFQDACGRMATKEANAIARLGKKSDTLEAFMSGCQEFYAKHTRHVIESVTPACQSLAQMSGLEEDDLELIEDVMLESVNRYATFAMNKAGQLYSDGKLDTFAAYTEKQAMKLSRELIEQVAMAALNYANYQEAA